MAKLMLCRTLLTLVGNLQPDGSCGVLWQGILLSGCIDDLIQAREVKWAGGTRWEHHAAFPKYTSILTIWNTQVMYGRKYGCYLIHVSTARNKYFRYQTVSHGDELLSFPKLYLLKKEKKFRSLKVHCCLDFSHLDFSHLECKQEPLECNSLWTAFSPGSLPINIRKEETKPPEDYHFRRWQITNPHKVQRIA